MTKRTPPDATTRLLRARKAAAKELNLSVTDWRVRRYALLMNAHDNLTAQLAAGAGVSIDGLLKLDASMQEIRATIPPEPIKVKIEYVQGVVGLYTCRHCGKRNELPEGDGEGGRAFENTARAESLTSGHAKPGTSGRVPRRPTGNNPFPMRKV
jgi:hypothetical protein